MELITQEEIVLFNSHIDRSNDCWIWKWYTTAFGHGQFRIKSGLHYAHRLAYFIANPSVDTSMFVLHKCDNPSCVNPSHLYHGTQTDNCNDRTERNRLPKGEDCSWTKLTDTQVLEIKRLYSEGKLSQKRLAFRYRVNQSQISRIVNDKRRT